MPARLIFASTAMVLVLATGCSFGGSDAGRADNTTDAILVDEATMAVLRDLPEDFQAPLADDRRLTFGEYERLVYTYIQCVTDAGGQVVKKFLAAGGSYYIEIATPPGVDPVMVSGCATRYWNPLGPLWSRENQPDREVIEKANVAFGDCLYRAGVLGLPGAPDRQKLAQVFARGGGASVLNCSQRIEDEFALPNFAGS